MRDTHAQCVRLGMSVTIEMCTEVLKEYFPDLDTEIFHYITGKLVD